MNEFEITTNRVPQNLKIQEKIGVPVVCFVSPLKRKTVPRVRNKIDRCKRCFAYPSKYSKIVYPDSWYCSLCGKKNKSHTSWVKRNGKVEFETNVYEICDETKRPRKRVVLALVDEDANESLVDDIKNTLIRTISSVSDREKNTYFALCSFSASGILRLYDVTCEHTHTISMKSENLNNVFTSRDQFFASRSEDSKRMIQMLHTSNIIDKRPVLLAYEDVLRDCSLTTTMTTTNMFCAFSEGK